MDFHADLHGNFKANTAPDACIELNEQSNKRLLVHSSTEFLTVSLFLMQSSVLWT